MSNSDNLTLDQIRLFINVADEGSFSGAAKRLHRAQSAVSYGIANLESALACQLFDRSGRKPVLTPTGKSLLHDARQVLATVQQLNARANAVNEGTELEISIAVDVICPANILIELGRSFQSKFPNVDLSIQADVLEGVPALVRDGSCQIGISGPLGVNGVSLERRFLGHIPLIPVAAPTHALSKVPGPISTSNLESEVQIVISQRTGTVKTSNKMVISHSIWKVADAPTKLELIRAGLGWGNLPASMVKADLERGSLVQLQLEEFGPDPQLATISSITHVGNSLGPAGSWLLDEIATICQRLYPTRSPAQEMVQIP